jgi:hypothetical protein
VSPFRIIPMAGLAGVLGVLIALVGSRWASDVFRGWFDPQVSAAFEGTIQPDAAHAPLRAILLARVRRDGTLAPESGAVFVHRSGIPTPGVLNAVPQLDFDGARPPDAAAVHDWLVRAGVDPGEAATAAAAEIASIVQIAAATPTRAALDDLQARLPSGTPEPQLLDVAAHAPGWLELVVGVGAAVLVVVPTTVVVVRRTRLLG